MKNKMTESTFLKLLVRGKQVVGNTLLKKLCSWMTKSDTRSFEIWSKLSLWVRKLTLLEISSRSVARNERLEPKH